MTTEQASSRQLMNSCQGLVRSIAWKIHQRLPKSLDLDDLIGYGQIGLGEAARDFDPSMGTQFTTYAYYRVRGAIFDGLSKMSWFSKADFARGKYERAASDVMLDDRIDEQPGNDVAWFRSKCRSLSSASILTQLFDNELNVEETTGDEPGYEIEFDELKSGIRAAMSRLPDAERSIIESVYFDGLSIKDAGERLKISKAWASRLHSRALELMSHQLTAFGGTV